MQDYWVKRLQECNIDDTEMTHILADEVLCELLKELGYDKVVEAFEDLPKWYS